ncbi:MAG: hypothetical protein WD716_08805 [Fimbriimonadaceae bacterium]|jgi:hypothetical protein
MSVAPWINEASAALPSARTRKGKTRGSVSTAPRTSVIATACVHAAVLSVASLVFYGLFSLTGHSLLNSAYKQRVNSELRTEGARSDVLELGRQVSGLVSTESLDQFASAHGFERPGGLVASNHGTKEVTKVQ